MVEFEYKQVLVIRVDLGMSKGKIAAQAAHAAVTSSEKTRKYAATWWSNWFNEGQKKVVVKVSSEKELIDLKNAAEKNGIPSALITDRGLTEIPPGTITALGLGPAPNNVIDKITGHLPLL
ncbi:MAG: peptidyl-tRNA hydrolase Pth2 [Candidatus Odinarchaeia archaeon]